MQLAPAITRVGLDHQVGPEGRFLSSVQRAVVSLVRALIRRPDLLVLDGALSPMGEARARTVLGLLLERFGRENSLVVVLPNDRVADRFQLVLRAAGTQIHGPEMRDPEMPAAPAASPGEMRAGTGAAAPAAALSVRPGDEAGPEPVRVEQDVKA